ncbi:Putative retroelement [Phytophthora palmivora]|uniref:Retroelement n=1 Tax=Phytophthora palmivora TaxID=4796 RepID=A0A2P4YMC9_9STRA|nr:Putative retroelement [Phytophthora palmivora]
MFTLLLKKNKRNTKIHFNDEQLKDFNELKRRLCKPPMLHLPNLSEPMHLRTYASKFAVGGVLFQVVNGVGLSIAYTSRKMKSAEINYPTQQQELLAIVHALAAFRIYCLDKPPIVETDHKSLEEDANRRLARCYDILVKPDLQPETKFFHDVSVTSFDGTSFSLALKEVTLNTELIISIKTAYATDREVQAILAAIKHRASNLKPKGCPSTPQEKQMLLQSKWIALVSNPDS